MGILAVYTFMTLDEVVQAPGQPNEDREGGFEHGGWQAPYLDEESGKVLTEDYSRLEAILLGRKTYEIFAGYWPKAPAENPFAAKLNSIPKYVASRTLKTVTWKNAKLIQGDAAKAVPQLKRQHRELHVIGSGDLVQTLLRHDLVDRLSIWLYPLVLGTGKRLFADGTVPAALKLEESRTFPSGALLLRYQKSGKPAYGNAAESTAVPRRK